LGAEIVVKKPAANLTVIHGEPLADLVEPPSDLGATGAALWVSIQRQYQIRDSGGMAMLKLACEASDRAQRCRQQIDQDGEMIRTRTGVRSNPLLRDELANRAFVVRTLGQLGLDLEPVKAIGRPPSGGIGISWKDLRAD
jgi:hypothetical protein